MEHMKYQVLWTLDTKFLEIDVIPGFVALHLALDEQMYFFVLFIFSVLL